MRRSASFGSVSSSSPPSSSALPVKKLLHGSGSASGHVREAQCPGGADGRGLRWGLLEEGDQDDGVGEKVKANLSASGGPAGRNPHPT